MKIIALMMVNFVALVSQAGTPEAVYTQMLGNGTSWIYTMFSPSLYQFYEEQGGLTHLASKEVEYRVYDVQESDGRTCYLVKEELLLPGTRGINSTRFYQGNYLALREEGGRVMAGYDDYRSFLESSDQIVKAGNPSYIPYPKTDKGELILYDFTLQEGDKYAAEMDGHPEIIVEKVDSFIDEVGKARRQLTLSNGCIIIEGIGCINSRGMLLSYLNPGEPIDDYIFWLSFNDDGSELVYHNEVDVSTLGIADCFVPSPNGADGTVYTLGGVRLKSPSKGVNIIRQSNGTMKKVIMR